jgi:hypothetical protein
MNRRLRHASKLFQGLAQNPAHSFSAGYALSIYASDAIYTFIPKNACSTMRYSLALANGAIDGPEHFNWIHSNNNTFRASLRDLARATYTFVILRDPFLRLASCYLDKMVDQNDPAWSYYRLLNYEQQPADLTFRQFVTQLKPVVRANEHWRPQTDFLVYQTYDNIFCFEKFEEVKTVLQERIGFTVRDARSLTKHGTDQYAAIEPGQCFADVSAFDLLCSKRSGKVPRLQDLYDEEIVRQVRALYAEDIELYEMSCNRETIFPSSTS